MSEWLDLMLAEIARKRREAKEAEEEDKRRQEHTGNESDEAPDQSK